MNKYDSTMDLRVLFSDTMWEGIQATKKWRSRDHALESDRMDKSKTGVEFKYIYIYINIYVYK